MTIDRTQLITIAVTAVVGVTAKEILTWMVSFIKSSRLVTTVSEKVKSNWSIASDLAWFLLCAVSLIFEVSRSAPVTRIDVLRIVALAIASLFAAAFLAWNVIGARLRRGREKDR